ncbi:unnamed protein product [Ilex paraguariensis]|uniref:PB1-like domain-containing protein n=1 Tax=Ilex paraguariensis TaxID=185542 RepID=A0ABC8QLZ7_9AQUA
MSSHDSSLFSMKVHYNGQFTESPNKAYVGGKINYIDDCDCELMSLIEMDDITNTLSYAPYIGFYYKFSGLDLDKGLVHMSSDEHVLDMSHHLHKNRVAQVYFKHIGGIKLLESQTGSSRGKNNHSVDGDHPIDDNGIGDGEASESECSECEDLVDNDYESEYDDMLYENCVDHEVEWTSLKSNSQKTTVTGIRHGLDPSDSDGDSEDIVSCCSSSDGETDARKKNQNLKCLRKTKIMKTQNLS